MSPLRFVKEKIAIKLIAWESYRLPHHIIIILCKGRWCDSLLFTSRILSRRRRPNELQILKERVSELLNVFEEKGVAVPLVEEETRKAFRTRGAGNAQDKKKERKKNERQLLQKRVDQLESTLKEKGVVWETRKDSESSSSSSDSDDSSV